jgi:hypothetical protein
VAAMIEKLCVENKIPEAWDGLELPQVGLYIYLYLFFLYLWVYIYMYMGGGGGGLGETFFLGGCVRTRPGTGWSCRTWVGVLVGVYYVYNIYICVRVRVCVCVCVCGSG